MQIIGRLSDVLAGMWYDEDVSRWFCLTTSQLVTETLETRTINKPRDCITATEHRRSD